MREQEEGASGSLFEQTEQGRDQNEGGGPSSWRTLGKVAIIVIVALAVAAVLIAKTRQGSEQPAPKETEQVSQPAALAASRAAEPGPQVTAAGSPEVVLGTVNGVNITLDDLERSLLVAC